jgi:hypothetical protein
MHRNVFKRGRRRAITANFREIIVFAGVQTQMFHVKRSLVQGKKIRSRGQPPSTSSGQALHPSREKTRPDAASGFARRPKKRPH